MLILAAETIFLLSARPITPDLEAEDTPEVSFLEAEEVLLFMLLVLLSSGISFLRDSILFPFT